MEITINVELCSGCELCADLAPDVFQMGDDTAELIVTTVPDDLIDDVQEAMDSCPSEAIVVVG